MALETKPGLQTTEFWTMGSGSLATVMMTITEKIAPDLAAVLITITVCVYMLCRAWSKAGQPYSDPSKDDWEQMVKELTAELQKRQGGN